jgi:hypothetical protein
MTRLGGKVVAGESMLELDFLVVTDAFEDDIVDVTAQPYSMSIWVQGRKRTWTPDFLIIRSAGFAELVEVKYLSWIYHRDVEKRALARARLQAMEGAARERNCVLRVLTEDEIRVQPRLANAKLIHRHCSPLANKAQLVAALSALARLPNATNVSALQEVLGSDHGTHALALAIRLERMGHIRIDRKSPYTRWSCFSKISNIPGGER